MSFAWFAVAAAILFVKFLVTTSLQGVTRLRTKTFQYPEDARHWGGTEPAQEDPLVVRAQRLLRNDAEGQPLFLALGLAFVALGGAPLFAAIYFLGYASSRVVHALFLLRPRQPHRNRAFGVGMVSLAALAVHTVILAAGQF